MIVVDANLFLRFITRPQPGAAPRLFVTADALFTAVGAGELEYTTSDAIVAEVVWVLTKTYEFPREAVRRPMRSLLNLPGCRMPTKNLCVEALDAWAVNPKLSFIDALIARMAETGDYELATLDEDLASFTSTRLWHPNAV